MSNISEDLFELTKEIVDYYVEDEKITYEFIQKLKEVDMYPIQVKEDKNDIRNQDKER
jgi:hypothetical protein